MSDLSDSDNDLMVTPPESTSPEEGTKHIANRDTVKSFTLQHRLRVDFEELTDEEGEGSPMVTPSEGLMPEFPSIQSTGVKVTRPLSKLTISDKAPVHSRSLLTPTSPSSVFNKTGILTEYNCIVKGVLLSQWDNILGPRIRHLWYTNEAKGFTLDALNHIAVQTLCGDICRDPESAHIDSKLYLIKEKDVLVHTFLFGAMGKANLAVHSLSLIIPQNEHSLYMKLYSLCSTLVNRLIAKLRLLLEKGPTTAAMQSFTVYLKDFIDMLSSLSEYSVSQYIPISQTAFAESGLVEENFLRKAILSHLITGGYSLVIGQSTEKINLMISTLALFLSQDERCCSRLASNETSCVFHPDLNVQGLLKDTQLVSACLEKLTLSPRPTSLIDMSTEDVRHSSISKHLTQKQEMMQDELLNLWKGEQQDSLNYSLRNLCHSFNDTESLVTTLIEEMSFLEGNLIAKEAYVLSFNRLLRKKALALIEYIEADTHFGATPLKKSVKKLRTELGLSLDGDFKVVLACADKLRPGVSSLLLTDVNRS